MTAVARVLATFHRHIITRQLIFNEPDADFCTASLLIFTKSSDDRITLPVALHERGHGELF